jgi:hypothetical protein
VGALTLIHRWLGIVFCLFFAMWFATGIVMHFIPFPELTEAERIAGLGPIDSTGLRHGPEAAVAASGIRDVIRVRLIARPDGLVYLIQSALGAKAVRAADLLPGDVRSESLALAIAVDHARRRGMEARSAASIELASHDQWTVPNGLDSHRPLYRIALNDDPGTELYVSSTTGEVVRDTARRERVWNYAGSVAHWIYPTVLRRDWRAWDVTVWSLSLIALVTAISGAVLGTLRVRVERGLILTPYRGWHAWHHWLGLTCMIFVLTWIFSGWLSMDHGRLFSTGKAVPSEAASLGGAAAWETLSTKENQPLAQAREVEWFAFAGRMYRRERLGLASQRLWRADDASAHAESFLEPDEVTAAARRLAPNCGPAVAVDASDSYQVAGTMPGAPIYRTVCGANWFHVNGATGALLEKLDGSRRTYRWLYSALHTLDFPVLTARPYLRTTLIVTLCGLGLGFSLTAVVIGWRRLKRDLYGCNAVTK